VQTSNPSAIYPSLSNRVVLVTGGASGIGAAVVEAFARQSASVIFLDVQDDAAGSLKAMIEAEGRKVPAYYRCDLTDTNSLQATIATVVERFGKIDVLVNNAGNDTRHSVESVTPEFWDRCMAINLKQQFFACQAVIPKMREARRGSIVNMSSIAWTIPSTGLPVYVAAKAAIVGMTRTLAHELGGDNIRVNCIMPGAILTKRQKELWLTPEYEAEVLHSQALKRLIAPGEVANLALFLASDASAAITNQSFIIDAGWT
jgi:NAD(P)-dependent dehydrogenase (short-subunit alcohol dehydrogenase family)